MPRGPKGEKRPAVTVMVSHPNTRRKPVGMVAPAVSMIVSAVSSAVMEGPLTVASMYRTTAFRLRRHSVSDQTGRDSVLMARRPYGLSVPIGTPLAFRLAARICLCRNCPCPS